jgi:hypothetical protein
METQQATQRDDAPSQLVAFERWRKAIPISRATGHRWRTSGVIKTVNIFGRVYIQRSEIERFERAAANGEFFREAKCPRRHEEEQLSAA